jgi:hypothetical protein
VALFPYLKKARENKYIWKQNGWRSSLKAGSFDGLTTSSFEYHMNQVPFVWEYLMTEIKMLFIGGLVGVAYEKDKSVVPVFGYAITEDQVIRKGEKNDDEMF